MASDHDFKQTIANTIATAKTKLARQVAAVKETEQTIEALEAVLQKK